MPTLPHALALVELLVYFRIIECKDEYDFDVMQEIAGKMRDKYLEFYGD